MYGSIELNQLAHWVDEKQQFTFTVMEAFILFCFILISDDDDDDDKEEEEEGRKAPAAKQIKTEQN